MTTENSIATQATPKTICDYNSRIIEDHPADTLVRVNGLLSLYQSVDWDSPMVGAINGRHALLDEVQAALNYVIEQIQEVQQSNFESGE